MVCGLHITSIPPTLWVLHLAPQTLTDSYRVDVSSPESLATGFGAFQTDFNNALDICVPCAGINRHQTFLEFNYADHQELLGVNVLGLFHTAQLAARQMIANGTKHGSIVLVASMASHVAVRSQLCSAYCGSKGAVRAMCPAIAKELAEYVCPYWVDGVDRGGGRG